MKKQYVVTFIKDRDEDKKKIGQKYGPIIESVYLDMLEKGYIEDEHGLAKQKPKKKQKLKIEEINLED